MRTYVRMIVGRRQPLLAEGRDDAAARPAVVAVLAEVDPLPRPERQPAVRHGDRQRAPGERRLHVRGHVVRALQRVRPVRRVLRHGPVEPGREVAQHVRRRVLVQRQRGRGVAHEHRRDADGHRAQLRHRLRHLMRDEVEAARPRREPDLPLDPHMDGILPPPARPDLRCRIGFDGLAPHAVEGGPAAARRSRPEPRKRFRRHDRREGARALPPAREAMARTTAALAGTGAGLLLLGAALPHGPGVDGALLLALALAAAATGAIAALIYDRMPVWGFHALGAWGTILTSVGVYAWGPNSF